MAPRRALVLGGGGVTGIAWQAGVLAALSDAGVRLEEATRVVGTSAGAVVGAHLTLGRSPQELVDHHESFETLARVDLALLWPLLVAQLAPDRARALRWVGRRAAARARLEEADFVARLSRLPAGTPWPEPLVVTALDAATGLGVALDRACGLDLATAVAASASVPGVFPPVGLDGVPHLDGGLRSPANADLAAGCDRVLVLAPVAGSFRRARRPGVQLRALGEGVAWLLVTPDAAARRAIGLDPLDATRSAGAVGAGRRQGHALADVARRVWG